LSRTLTRRELTAALGARQMLIERERLAPAEAIRRLTPLQGQHTLAPHIALAARLEGFDQADLDAAFGAGEVVKTSIMRMTLHVSEASEYPAYAQLSRQARIRKWRKDHPQLDEERIAADLTEWLREPRTNAEIRERVVSHGMEDGPYMPLHYARILVPVVHVPPAGYWANRTRAVFTVDPRPLPDPVAAARLVIERYLAAFGPAGRRDAAAWAGVPQRDFAEALEQVETVSYRDENGVELLDLPGQPLPPAGTRLPVRFLAHWDQPLLAHADRERIIPAEVLPLKLTLSGDTTFTVDGRVAGSWDLEREGEAVKVTLRPHVEIGRAATAEVRAEAERTARFCEPGARSVSVTGL
jgi:winged helix DNA-binding protein